MARAEPRKVARYGDQFKATAVKLSSLPGVLIQDVAAALDIHLFMLSLWRMEVRDGVIVAKSAKLDVQTTAELKRLRDDAAKGKLRQIRHHFWCPFLVGQRSVNHPSQLRSLGLTNL
ncbi:MAG: transposase [Burkholderiales bacterium]